MKPDCDEEQIRALFCELRHGIERRTPAFDRAWQAAVARSRKASRPALFKLAVAAAMAGAMGGATAILLGHRPSHKAVAHQTQPYAPRLREQAALGISQWRSPTAFLLEPPIYSDSPGGSAQKPYPHLTTPDQNTPIN